jgi:hypothetical protein
MWRIRVVVGRSLQYRSALVLRVRAQPVRYGSSRSSFVPRRFSHQVRFPCCRAGGFSRHTHFLRRVVARCKRCAPILEVGVQIALGMLVSWSARGTCSQSVVAITVTPRAGARLFAGVSAASYGGSSLAGSRLVSLDPPLEPVLERAGRPVGTPSAVSARLSIAWFALVTVLTPPYAVSAHGVSCSGEPG